MPWEEAAVVAAAFLPCLEVVVAEEEGVVGHP
jgi:hypothetical protein